MLLKHFSEIPVDADPCNAQWHPFLPVTPSTLTLGIHAYRTRSLPMPRIAIITFYYFNFSRKLRFKLAKKGISN